MKNEYQKYLDKYVNNKMRGFNKDFNRIVNEVNDELYNEVIKMYDKLIDDFYSYKTTSYIRHGESKPGTGRGITLYRGQDFKKIRGIAPKLILNVNPNILSSGERQYQHDPAERVFDTVMYGIRFPFGQSASTWVGEYQGKYFSFKGTPDSIFNNFDRWFNQIAETIFYQKLSKTKWYNQ